jgi:hypothetical protein
MGSRYRFDDDGSVRARTPDGRTLAVRAEHVGGFLAWVVEDYEVASYAETIAEAARAALLKHGLVDETWLAQLERELAAELG